MEKEQQELTQQESPDPSTKTTSPGDALDEVDSEQLAEQESSGPSTKTASPGDALEEVDSELSGLEAQGLGGKAIAVADLLETISQVLADCPTDEEREARLDRADALVARLLDEEDLDADTLHRIDVAHREMRAGLANAMEASE